MLYIAARECTDGGHDAAWQLLYSMLAAFGISDLSLISHHKNGKPYLKGDALYFSLSHTKGAVCCAVCAEEEVTFSLRDGTLLFCERTPKLPVGVDLEKHIPRDFSKIARGFFTPDECEFFASCEDKCAAFYRIYTRKESLSKASGRGISELRQQPSTLSRDDIYTYNIELGGNRFSLSAALLKK